MDNELIIQAIETELNISNKEATVILTKAITGGEITSTFGAKDWYEQRFLPNLVFIKEDGYAKMCVDALKILQTTAATDYGSSRQRDFGQVWADMTRGYLGEYAFQMFLKQKWNIESKLGHELGDISQFLDTDIPLIKTATDTDYHPPKSTLSIKTTKWNGIWFDIPGDQFNHTAIHTLVKVGTGRDHLFAFFKNISVFRDKVLKQGELVGALTPSESDTLYNQLPSFAPIPAYICGFMWRDTSYKPLSYHGKMGRKHYTISSWNGPISSGDLEAIKAKEAVPGNVKFESIGTFSHDKGYLFNTGSLLWSQADWEKLRQAL